MCRVSALMSSVVLFFAWSSTLVLSHSIGWCCPQAYSAMADFSVSPCLVAALCSLMRVSRALSVYLIYTWPQLQGIWYTTPNIFSSGSWSLTLASYPRRMDANRKTVWMLYLLHTRLTSLLRPATYGMNAVAWGSSAGSLAVWAATTVLKNYSTVVNTLAFDVKSFSWNWRNQKIMNTSQPPWKSTRLNVEVDTGLTHSLWVAVVEAIQNISTSAGV